MTLSELLQIVGDEILWRLEVADLRNLWMTCRALNKLLNDDNLWRILVQRRHGSSEFLDESYEGLCPCRHDFVLRTCSRKNAGRFMQGIWVDDPRYWHVSILPDNSRVMDLDHVWWLEAGIIFRNVQPGFYKVQWSVAGFGRFAFYWKTLRFPVAQPLTANEIASRSRDFSPGDGTQTDDLSLVRFTEVITPRRAGFYRDDDYFTEFRVIQSPQIFRLARPDHIITGIHDISPRFKHRMRFRSAELVLLDASSVGDDIVLHQTALPVEVEETELVRAETMAWKDIYRQ
eukprot:Gregarina_sp_Poly_1__2960@NODE_182_length_11803_cov_169_166752_g162_i0_p6_GENE_NODE_182_length_11803_cov_169_166752_g162_i0NODE_182_length_11803_cov_169_166752_g162_i0_p6_ORF_typecomplete_len288_score23_99PP2/PF14299_6/0_00076Fbox/PF00646_33/0_019_NODE_182_length_11803_cov_169_166752_g162_i04091272